MTKMRFPPYPKLSNAPIVEAVIELKVSTRTPIEIATLLPVKATLGDRFPIVRDIHGAQLQIRMDEAGGQQHGFHAGPIGIRLESSDGGFVILARVDGVSISKLAPYDRWDGLRDIAREVWSVYAKAVDPIAITRIGVRYINRIELQQELIDFDKVLTAGPKIPEAIPQALVEFFTRVVVPIPDKRAMVTIAQTFESAAPATTGSLSYPAVVLDVDTFIARAFEINDPGAWAALESLRDVKNMAFFNSITEETLETLK